MTGGDKTDIRDRLESLRNLAGRRPDLLDARPDEWRRVWFADDAEKWPRMDDEDTPLWAVDDPESGQVYDVNLKEIATRTASWQDPDVVIDA